MAGNLKMDTTEFTNLATQISTENENIGDCLREIQRTIESLGRTWTGDAYNAAKNKIDDFYAKTYVPYKDAVQGYVDFINTTKTTYDTTEENLADTANRISVDALGKFTE